MRINENNYVDKAENVINALAEESKQIEIWLRLPNSETFWR